MGQPHEVSSGHEYWSGPGKYRMRLTYYIHTKDLEVRTFGGDDCSRSSQAIFFNGAGFVLPSATTSGVRQLLIRTPYYSLISYR